MLYSPKHLSKNTMRLTHSATGYSFSLGRTGDKIYGFDLVWLWLELAHCHYGCFFIAAGLDESLPVSQEPRF